MQTYRTGTKAEMIKLLQREAKQHATAPETNLREHGVAEGLRIAARLLGEWIPTPEPGDRGEAPEPERPPGTLTEAIHAGDPEQVFRP